MMPRGEEQMIIRCFFHPNKPGRLLAMVFLFTSVALADDYLLVSRTETDSNYQYQASPADWRDINIYQLFTDRFYDGDSSNNQTGALDINRDGWFVDGHSYPETKNYHHGGDWAGLKQKLDYLDNMGVNAIWISGVQMNAQGRDTRFTPYHQYHPTDFWRCDPVSGTFLELKDLIDDCHSRGIYVILDVVINHMSDLAGLPYGSDDAQYWPGGNPSYTWWDTRRHRGAFNRLDFFHHNGTINNWDASPENLLGQFKGTDDLATERADVQYELDIAFKNLISATDCDGFRVDAIKHVEYNWCKQWADDMRQHAASLGKSDFLLFGELFSYDNAALASYCSDNGYSFNSALFFPMANTIKSVFKDGGGTGQLTSQRSNISQYGEGADRLVTFIDNHDVNRISLEMGGDYNDDVAKLKPAMTFLYTAMPVPLLYYGTEHCFDQGGHWNNTNGEEDADHQRECMFDRGFQPGPAYGNKFDGGPSPLYSHIAAINTARNNHKSLTRGSFAERWQEGSAGAYAYLRNYSEEEALVAFNTAYDSRSITPNVDKPDGTAFTNVLNASETVTVSGGQLSFSLNGKESKIFVAGAVIDPLSIDHTYHWPLSGDVDPVDDLWINVAALPVGTSTNAYVVYSSDGGTTWTNASMTPDASITSHDGWHVNMGTFAAGTVIEYAVCVQDDEGEVWDNNNFNNYSVTINGGSSAQWTPTTPHNCIGSTVEVVYSPNDGILNTATNIDLVYGFFFDTSTNWTGMSMAEDGTNWTINLGIPTGSLKMELVFTDGAGSWDNNDSQNWTISLNTCAVTDSDGDHIPDEWETSYGFDISNAVDAAGDYDGDGMVNSNEYIAGTDPTNAASRLALAYEIISNGIFRLSWPVADAGRHYTVLCSTNLLSGTFEVVQSNLVGALPGMEFTDPSATNGETCFYRILAELPQ
jgi:glycosidase